MGRFIVELGREFDIQFVNPLARASAESEL